MVVVLIVLSALFTVLTAAALGGLLVQRLRIPLLRQERPVIAFLLGAACLSLIVFALCATHLYYRGVVFAIVAAALLWAWRAKAYYSPQGFAPLDKFEQWMLLFFAPFTVLYLANAVAPEVSPDGSTYHLGIIAHYVRAHGFVPLHTTMYSSLSQGVELVYMVAFTFGKHSAAAVVHWVFFASTAWLMICFGRRVDQTKATIAAAFLFYASPIAGVDGSSAYIDCATAAIVFTIFYLVWLWKTAASSGLLIAVGLLCGYAYGAKYTAAAIALYALLVIRKPRPVLIVLVCSLFLSTPWLLKNYYYTGNPVAPFFNRLFPNPYQHVLWEEDYKAYFKTYNIPNVRMIPWDLTVKGQVLGGLLGPVFLLVPLALLGLRRREIRHLWLAGLICLIPYPLNIGTRFLILALPFFSLALAQTLALANVRVLLPTLMLAHGLLSWPRTPPGLLGLYCGATWRIIHAPFQQALRIEPEDRYLSRTQPAYLKARLIDKYVPPGEVVFSLGSVQDAYTTHQVAVFYQTALGENLADLIFTGMKPDRQGIKLMRFRIPPTSLRRIRVEQTEVAGPAEQWAISELRYFNAGNELERNPKWRLTAMPNWWEIEAAFDNSPVTRWRTRQQSKPGDYVETDFGSAQTVDQVDLLTSPDHWKTRVRVLGLVDGAWNQLGNNPEESELPIWRFARRMATLEIAARGIHYIMVESADYGARDIIQDPEFWGLKELGRTGETHLYRIEPLQMESK